MAIAQGLEERGQVGATHMGTGFDAWYAGYIDYTPMFKNIAAFWTETALAGMANTREYKIDAFPRDYKDLRPQALYTSPWAPGKWSLRDAVDYMYTASLSVLDYAARYKENVLLNRYRSGKWQIEKHPQGRSVRVCDSAGSARQGDGRRDVAAPGLWRRPRRRADRADDDRR